ncbi:tetratricopeptide repeat protein, partial [Marivibrio halodurans]|nr:tetratricopeptide repeat protein [Marivibrio halodurans]
MSGDEREGEVAMLTALIDILTELRDDSLYGQVQFLLAVGVVVVGPMIATFRYTRHRAKRRYQKGIQRIKELEDERAANEETIAALRADRKQGEARCETLLSEAPEGVLERIEREERDGNLDPAIAIARDYIGRNRTALHRAYRLLTDAAIIEASEDGAAGYANALLHARGGLAVAPEDEDLRDLAEELEQAAADPDHPVPHDAPHDAPGSPTTASPTQGPSDAATRAERRAARAALPADLDALQRCFSRAYRTGHWRLMRRFAEHGLRLARRVEGGETRKVLIWCHNLADAERLDGHPDRAFDLLEPETKPWEAVFGPDDAVSFRFRHSIASCLRRIGSVGEALEFARALLPDRERVQGTDHPDTLATRHLIATCLRDIGSAGEALSASRALLPDRERIKGEDHPETLTTRYLIATCLRDIGSAGEALSASRALLPD